MRIVDGLVGGAAEFFVAHAHVDDLGFTVLLFALSFLGHILVFLAEPIFFDGRDRHGAPVVVARQRIPRHTHYLGLLHLRGLEVRAAALRAQLAAVDVAG